MIKDIILLLTFITICLAQNSLAASGIETDPKGEMDFGMVPINSPNTKTLTIKNTGEQGDPEIEINNTTCSDPPTFTCKQSNVKIAAGKTFPISVTYTPTPKKVGIKETGSLVIDSDVSNFPITLSGTPGSFKADPLLLDLSCVHEKEIKITGMNDFKFYAALDQGNKFAICYGHTPCTGAWSTELSDLSIGLDGLAYISVKYTGDSNDIGTTILFKKEKNDSPADTLAEVSVGGAGMCLPTIKPPYEAAICKGLSCSILENPWLWVINPWVFLSLVALPVLTWGMGRNFGAAYQTNWVRMIVAATGFAGIAVGGTIGAGIVLGSTALLAGGALLRKDLS